MNRRKSDPEINAELLTRARHQRAEIAADILKTRNPLVRKLLRMARRLTIWCENGARQNITGKEKPNE